MRDKAPRFIEVALPLPLFQTFTYAVEDGLANPVAIGSRVIVPLRNGKEVGICIGVSDVMDLLSAREPIDTILEEYPYLELEDIYACLAYAALAVDDPAVSAHTLR